MGVTHSGLAETMIILYAATTNPGKLRDFATVADGRCTILPLPGLGGMPVPEETSPTFEGNAVLKALAYAGAAPGHLILADDSGLEVDCLGGAPGVRSARYADDLGFPVRPGSSTDGRNNLCLRQALSTEPGPHTARYHCVLTLAHSVSPEPLATAQGIVEGEILSTPRGTGGFGYDPLFFLPALGRTMAELDPVTRLSFSHRGRALRNLLDQPGLIERLESFA